MEREFIIPASLVQAVANYLSQKPYREVAEMLAAFMNLRPHEPKPEHVNGTGSTKEPTKEPIRESQENIQ
jgi:hypothetical protein